MSGAIGQSETSRKARNAVRGLRLHGSVYVAVNGVLFLIDLFTAGSWWFFWPLLVWGVGIGCHYLYAKSVATDQGWADRKAEEIRLKAYDVSHIIAIDDSFKSGRSPGRRTAKAHDAEAHDAETHDAKDHDAKDHDAKAHNEGTGRRTR